MGDEKKTTLEELVTISDLRKFREELLSDIRELLKTNGAFNGRQWLKTKEVLKILGISPNTLAAMRNYGKVSYTRIGKVIYYSEKDLSEMFEANKVKKKDEGKTQNPWAGY